jgi:LmbE family N-acetylglucosaminyl deacetylase
MTSKLLVVVAHPDDETFGCGSVLLLAAAAGWETAVLCATRGEAGEINDGTPPDRLGAKREAETRAAGAVMGVAHVDFLDFGDSGMTGPAAPETLVGAPLDDVRDRVRAYLDDFRPDVIVTLDGADGHRDHARIGDATLAAVDVADHRVERVYVFALSQELGRRWIEYMTAHDPDREHLQVVDVPGVPPESITTEVDAAAHVAAREEAIRQHTSQRSPFADLPDDLRHEFLSIVQLRRVRPEWTGGPRETTFP